MSNKLDPDQTRLNVGPDLGPNCLQKLSADDSQRLCSAIVAFPGDYRLLLTPKCIRFNYFIVNRSEKYMPDSNNGLY